MRLMKHGNHAGCCILAMCLVIAPCLARAQSPTPPSEEEAPPDDARRFYLEGNKALERQDWAAAEAAFLKAWALSKGYDVAANLGQAAFKLGRPRDAAELLAYSLRHVTPSAKPAARARTQEALDAIKKEIVTVRFSVNVPGANISVDGKRIEPAMVAEELFVDPGRRAIEAKAPGYQPARATFEAKAGETRQVVLSLSPIRTSPPSLVPVIALGALSVAALGTGIGTTVAAVDKSTEARGLLDQIRATSGPCNGSAPPSACRSLFDIRAQQSTLSNTAVWSFVAAGTAAAGAVAYVLITRRSPEAEAVVSLAPAVGVGFAGVEVSGQW